MSAGVFVPVSERRHKLFWDFSVVRSVVRQKKRVAKVKAEEVEEEEVRCGKKVAAN